MADNMLDVRLQSAYKTSAVWATTNPILRAGEVGYESDTGWLFKVGNGTSTWNQLPYSNHRPLNNNDFDTINVTDLNAGKLIVTGSARFTNTIQGTAASASYASNAAKVNNLTVQTAVPAGAVFTDTKYSASASGKIALGGTNSTVFYHTTAFSASGSVAVGTAGTADAWGESISFTIPELSYDKWGHLSSVGSKAFKVAIPSNPNANYYTTAMGGATTTNGYEVHVAGNNAAVKGTAVIPSATSASYGVIKPDGTSSHFIDGVGTWRALATSDITSFADAVAGVTVTSAASAGSAASAATAGTASYATSAGAAPIPGVDRGLSVASNKIGHSNSITAGNIGPSANASPLFGGTFSVPYIAYDAYGHTTAVANRTITIPGENNAGFHNSIYRGKSLGTSITAEQWASIRAGTFEDMYIGDYWTISTTFGSTTSNVNYVIAGFDYWWNCGDSYPQTSNYHHIVLVPSSYLYSATMNATNVTTGGYKGSLMYTTNLANARTGISAVFGDHLYKVRRLFTTSVNSVGQAIGWEWIESSVDLMSETMVYGHPVWSTSGYEIGVDRTILPLFALNPASASIRAYWWLRSVASAACFARVPYGGDAYYADASGSYGVRPAFAIY